MKKLNLNDVQEAQGYKTVAPGGYICEIKAVEDVEEKEYLRMELDIAEGDFANHYQTLYEAMGFWGLSFIKSYKEKALPFFKSFITAVENSNPGYTWDDDETKLRGKRVGVVLAEEEYIGKDGATKTRIFVDMPRSIEAIKSNDFKVPAKKLLSGKATAPAPALDVIPDDEDLPF